MIPVLGVPTVVAGSQLRRLLDSIDHQVEHLVVIDNGAGFDRRFGPPREWFHSCTRFTCVSLPGNLGVAGAWNLIVKSTPFAPWWMIVNDDVVFAPGELDVLAEHASRDGVVVTAGPQPWSCFMVGDRAVDRVGLFDERFHPAYFEDNDYERRCRAAGVEIWQSTVAPEHHNSSTLAQVAGARERNRVTYLSNEDWHRAKSEAHDMSDGWSLTRRRALAWENTGCTPPLTCT